ncbi:MAG: hypothetical protein HC858_01810, partial [Brachymonas sp.]|nr:hypothetical protein [Brachymonas sp.]
MKGLTVLSIFKNNETGFVHAQTNEPTFWAPEKFKARYEKTELEARKELDLEARAREDGINRIPKSNSVEWSPTEQAIRTKCQNALTSEIDMLTKEIDHYEREIQKAGGSSLASQKSTDAFFDNNIAALQQSVGNALSVAGGSSGSRLLKAYQDRDKLQRELTAFRVEHRRNEDAKYPANKFWHIMIIVVILLAECIANSTFFGQGNELGLLGGIVEAFMFAAINIALAAAIATSLRYVTYFYTTPRILIGYLLTAALLAVMVFVACVAALYRYMAANAQTVEEVAFSALPWSQLGDAISNKDGIVLILIALILGVIAIVDCFKLDDAYAGYGKRKRAVQEVTDWIDDHKTEAAEELHSSYIKNMREKEIPARDQDYKKVLTRLDNIFRLTRDYDQAIVQQLTQTYHKLLKEYRDINLRVRNEFTAATDKPPAHFTDYPALDASSFDAVNKAHDTEARISESKTAYDHFCSANKKRNPINTAS